MRDLVIFLYRLEMRLTRISNIAVYTEQLQSNIRQQQTQACCVRPLFVILHLSGVWYFHACAVIGFAPNAG